MFKNFRWTWGSMHAPNSLSKRTYAIAMSCILVQYYDYDIKQSNL